MRKIIFLFCFILCFVVNTSAQSLTIPAGITVRTMDDVILVWTKNTDTETIGYRVYYGASPRTYITTLAMDAGAATTYTVAGLTPGIYYFAVTAYNASRLESAYSNEINVLVTEKAFPNFTFIGVTDTTVSTANITWTTSVDCNGTALYGTVVGTWKAVKSNNLGTTDHLSRLYNLTSATHYFYKVQSVCTTSGITKTLESDVKSFNTK